MPRLRPYWPSLVLLAEVLVFYRHVLFSHYLIPWDLQFYHQPLAWFASRSLGRGELPLWDPFTYCGMPIYANLTTQLFYPPTLVVYLVNNWIGDGRHLLYLLELQIVAHVLLAGILTLLLLRKLGAGTAAALAGATVYQLGAYFASQTQHLGAIDAAAWLPLCWMAVLELSDRYQSLWLAILTAALALTFLAGFPATTAVVYGTTLLLAALLVTFRKARWPLLAACAAAVCWSALLVAVQLFPTMELSARSVASLRADWMDSGGGLPARALVTLLAPNYFGVFQLDSGWRLPWNPTFLYLYCGIPAILLAVFAIGKVHNRYAGVFAVMVLAGALWMLGDSTPAYRLAFLVLPYKLKAALYSEFAMCAFTLGLAVLAGLGAQALLASRGRAVQGGVVLFMAIDLIAFSSGRPINTIDAAREPGVGHDHFDRFPEIPARMRKLVNQTEPPWRIDTMNGQIAWSSCANLFEVPTASGTDPFALVRFMQVRLSFTGGERWGRYYEVRDPNSPVLKLLNVRYVIANGTLPVPGGLVKREDLPGNMVYENYEPLPRFFLVGKTRRAADMEGAVRLLRSRDFDVRSEAVVESDVPSAAGAGEVRVTRYSPREVTLVTNANAPSFLVTSETWYPGWRAQVDGREVPLVITNGAFRGLPVPAGRHRVTMQFAPSILWRSALVSATALGMMLALAVRDNERSRWRWTS